MEKIKVDVLVYESYFDMIPRQLLPEPGMYFVCRAYEDIDLCRGHINWMLAEYMGISEPLLENDFNDDPLFDDVGFFHDKGCAEVACEAFERKRIMSKISSQVGQ